MINTLKIKQELLLAVFEASTDAIFVADENANLIYVNHIAAALVGKTPQEIIKNTPEELFPPLVAVECRKGIKTVFETAAPLLSDGRYHLFPGDRWMDIRFHPVRNPQGEVIAVFGNVRDITERKVLEEKLSSKEERYETALNSIGDGMIVTNTQDLITDINPVAERLTGWPKAEALGKSIRDIFRVIQSTDARFLVSRDGSQLPVSDNISPIRRRPDGEIMGRILVFSDISKEYTQRKRIYETQKTMVAITDTAPDAIILMDAEGRISSWNIKATEIFGYTRAEAIGKNLHQLLAPDRFLPMQEKNMKQFQESGTGAAIGKTLQLSAKHRDGREFPIELSLSSIKLQGKWNGIGIVRDITEKCIIEKKLEEDLRFRSTLLNVVPIPVFVKDRDGRYLSCNKAFEKFMGKTEEELLEKTFSESWLSDVPINYSEKDKELLSTGVSQAFDSVFTMPNGEIREITLHKDIINDTQGNIVGIVGAIVDMTEERKSNRERTRIHAQLIHSEKLASIGTLAAGVAHEINNPLTIIKGNTTFIRDTAGNCPQCIEHQKILDKLDTAVDRVAAIVNSLRTFARADGDVIENVDLHKVIQDTLGLCEVIYRKANVMIELDLKCTRSMVRGNTGKFHQILLNLLSNSKDATEGREGGGIIRISTRNEGSYAVLQVTDNGCGIDKKNMKYIFDPFFTTKPQGKGTGLGLSITHSIIESFGGTIDIDSKPGSGTTVTIRFPSK